MGNTKVLEFKSVSMEFPGVKALENVSFRACAGEVTALLGENGAGKSTLLKILNGDYIPSEGRCILDGEELRFKSPQDAIGRGIGIIYQERQIVQNLSVAENVYMGRLPLSQSGLVDFSRLHRQTATLMESFNLDVSPTAKVKDLSVAHQQLVEIMKVISRKTEVIAFDEPTAALSDDEIDNLFSVIGTLKAQGVIILYVSHRLAELSRIADKVVVLKDGRFVGAQAMKDTTELALVDLMVGRPMGAVFDGIRAEAKIGPVVLEAKSISTAKLRSVSLRLRAGEIVGLAGLVGAGRTELARALFGADPATEGELLLEGNPVRIGTPEKAISLGISLCPEDRKNEGIVPRRPVRDNIAMIVLRTLTRFGFVDKKKETLAVQEGITRFGVKTPSAEQKIMHLSGGNQQKAILARAMSVRPKVLILDEPTKGIDVGAKMEIYRIIDELANSGIAVLVISSELVELIGLCDRIAVMREGSITGELSRSEASEDAILCLAMLGRHRSESCEER